MLAPDVESIYLIRLIQAASYILGCAAGNYTGGQLLSAFSVTALLAAGGTMVLFLTVEKKTISEEKGPAAAAAGLIYLHVSTKISNSLC